jgi:hypothetical protein
MHEHTVRISLWLFSESESHSLSSLMPDVFMEIEKGWACDELG